MMRSSWWTRHTASMFATLPPPTKIRSRESRKSSGSATLGMGNSARWPTSAPPPSNQPQVSAAPAGSSPEAVVSTAMRGPARPVSPYR